jgi:hypothetical protein
MLSAVNARKAADRMKANPREELARYLQAPLENVDDVVAWWGVSHLLYRQFLPPLIVLQQNSRQFPILAAMARDYLAIQGSATPSERAFSSGSLTDTKRRNRLSPALFEALQILKSAYHAGHIKAAEQAEGHFQMLVDIISDTEDELQMM